MELYNDAHTFGLKSSNSKAVSNSNMAISWLEATFPELVHQDGGGGQLHIVRAQPFVHMDASVSLQVNFITFFSFVYRSLVLIHVRSFLWLNGKCPIFDVARIRCFCLLSSNN